MAVTGSTRNRFVLLIAGHVGSNPTLSARNNLISQVPSHVPPVCMFSGPPNVRSDGEMSELAEGARLEIACTTKSGTEGSNPSLSAIQSSGVSS